MAAGLLRARLAEAGVAADVASAGFGPPGEPAVDEAVQVMRDVDVDLRPHLSRHVTVDDLSGSDLVVVMTRQHAIDAVVLYPQAWPRTFPIVDLMRRGRRIGPIGREETLPQWTARVHVGRQRAQLLSQPTADDVDDPIGRPLSAFRRTRDLLDELVTGLAGLIAGDEGCSGSG
jgi:protein-tyrosine phosphatase